MDVIYIIAADGRSNQSIGAGRKRGIELGFVVGQLVYGLDLVEVERELAGYAAVDARLQVGRPVLVENVLPANVSLADSCDARVDRLAAVYVLDGRLPEEEVDVVVNVETSHEIRLCGNRIWSVFSVSASGN